MLRARRLLQCSCVLVTATALNAFAQECSESARLLRYACEYDLRDDYLTASAVCDDASAPDDGCFADARDARDEGSGECQEVFEARIELCDSLADAPHQPDFGEDFAGNFVDPLQIGTTITPNPYFPLVPGNRWVYEGGDETIVVTVLSATKSIDSVTCIVVNDVATENGDVIENTFDWYAQDNAGNVWYCGEIAENFEYYDGDEPAAAELVDIDGSWKAGRDGARPGILLPADPQVGAVIRQEVLYGDAEDAIEILSTTASEAAPGGSCSENCLQTRDFTPLEPDAIEHKFYVPGIGLIVEIDPDSGDRIELTEFTGVGS